MRFEYVIKYIQDAVVVNEPFRHIEITSLFSDSDFNEICECPQIALSAAENDRELFSKMFAAGYQVVEFPGCTTNFEEYISWHKTKSRSHKSNTSCEGFGVVVRLENPVSKIARDLDNFLKSDQLASALLLRFNILPDAYIYDAGIQKYLDGYEISPHPDIRRKAVTFMVNINTNPRSENEKHHTALMQYREPWRYVGEFWKYNTKIDRCWLPWDWCESVKMQTKNNSMVAFAPDFNTLHAVKADYDHLRHQRTQLYGNVWHETVDIDTRLRWEDFGIESSLEGRGNKRPNLRKRVSNKIKNLIDGNTKTISKSSSRNGLNTLTKPKK
jgi:hypothetical protein